MKSIFVKWEYRDHGWRPKELEIPEWALREYDSEEDSITEYIIENCNIPVWSERYLPSRLKWKKIEKSPEEMKEIYKKKITALRSDILSKQKEIDELSKLS